MELLRSRTLRCVLVLVSALVYPGLAMGDDPCDEVPRLAKFAASLPQLPATDLRQGAFRVRESGSRFAISYLIGGKAAFRGSLPQATDGIREITPIRGGGYSALFVQDLYGAGGRISCASIVFPSLTTHRFRALRVKEAMPK